MGSGMMGWTAGQFEELYSLWANVANQFPPLWKRGDQEFIQEMIDPKRVRFWQDEFPRQVVSYKVDCEKGLPSQAHVVCFHGRPRPNEVQDKWIKARWNLSGGNIL